ncbi:16S rRNA (adenine(1518)-N(6)/adenine(1519)-N(6))-dimethyltransferase RsmA [Spiribacter sp. 218]|uniref:16S rRNA (adenine(1518)-N(6)/adenine(1519)-N(6))- dimethyltransferase RsmA n=1 Tax=Spiribacter pallidus TaxID=1987936 RepID=UPI00349F32A0
MHQARRRFGQNFLHDPQVRQAMISAIDPRAEETFVEVGPGHGALTRPLLAAGVRLTAIELDRDLAAALPDACGGDASRLTLIKGDALAHPLSGLADADQPLRVVGNLPYNLSSPLLFHLTAEPAAVTDLHLLLQKEVVDRMGAEAGSRAYGRLSVMIQARCRVVPLFEVPAQAFRPAPRVTSRFVHLIPHDEPPLPGVDDKALATVVSHAFAQRRKTLRNALRRILDAAALERAQVAPAERAENLTLADFGRLAAEYQRNPTPAVR